jgi:hypothetical protein
MCSDIMTIFSNILIDIILPDEGETQNQHGLSKETSNFI